MPAGGIIVVTSTEDAGAVRSRAAEMSLLESLWDNGTVTAETLT